MLTKLNTKINRDYLDNSKYYFEKGYKKIYENNKSSIRDNIKDSQKEKEEKFFIKKTKKVVFSNNIIYENEFWILNFDVYKCFMNIYGYID